MKRNAYENLHARGLEMSCTLVTHSNTVEDIRKEIDEANKRAIELGYKAAQYFITCEEIYIYYDDNGEFVKKETYEGVIEKYPAKL